MTGRLFAFDITGPGEVGPGAVRGFDGRVVATVGGFQLFDSLAVEADGHVCVATIINGGITAITPEGEVTELVSNSFFTSRFQNLSGVDFDQWGNMYVSDLTAGKVWRMLPNKKFQVIAEYLPSPADLGVDRVNNLILVPFLQANVAEVNGLELPVGLRGDSKKRTLADYGFVAPPKTDAGGTASK